MFVIRNGIDGRQVIALGDGFNEPIDNETDRRFSDIANSSSSSGDSLPDINA
jgi:hypothetical protein